MYIYILLAFFVIALVVSYFIFNKEIMQPAIIFCTAYMLSVLCATVNITKWNINMDLKTFLILSLGAVEFIVISYLIFIFMKKKTIPSNQEKEKIIKTPKWIIVFLIIYNIIVIGLLLYNVLNIASQFGTYSSFSQALTIYKEHTSYSNDTELPDYLTILMKPIISMAYIGIFIFANNTIYSDEKFKLRILKNSYYLVFPLIYIFQRLIESNRGSILNLCVGAIAMAIMIWSIKNDWKKHIKLKIITMLFIAACIELIIFYYCAPLIGRINNKKMFDYITFYVGGSIECFNQWLKNPTTPDVVPGEYTFARTINDLNKLGMTKYTLNNENYSKFVYYKDTAVGNVYTSYRSWMHDWGIGGIIVLQAILAIVINALYNFIKYSNKFKNYMILIYGYIIYVIFMHPIDSYFYLEFFTIANIAAIIIMTIIYYVLINYRKILQYLDKLRKEKRICQKN